MFAFWHSWLLRLFDGACLGSVAFTGNLLLFLCVGSPGLSNSSVFLGVRMGLRFWCFGALEPCVWCVLEAECGVLLHLGEDEGEG